MTQPATTPTHRRLRVAAWRGRWWLAAGALALAARLLIPVLVPTAAPSLAAVVASHDITPGTTLTAADVRVIDMPDDVVPTSAFDTASAVVGRVTAVGLPRGQVLTDEALVGPGLTADAGTVVTPITPSDAALTQVLRPGDTVDVMAADGGGGPASLVAAGVRVAAVLPGDDTTSATPAVLVAVTPRQAQELAGAAALATLSLALVS